MASAQTAAATAVRSEGDSDPRLRRIGPVQTSHSRDVWLLTLSELRTTNRVRAFIDHFVEQTARTGS